MTPMPLLRPASHGSSEGKYAAPTSLEDMLFDNAADLKITLSQIVMHLEPIWRTVIFGQLDSLLDYENWQDDSAFIQKSSFRTFLRFIIFAGPTRLPSLGVSQEGKILAAWSHHDQRMAVEFFEDDQAVATFVRQGSRSKETMSWRGHVVDLKTFISANAMTGCLLNEPSVA